MASNYKKVSPQFYNVQYMLYIEQESKKAPSNTATKDKDQPKNGCFYELFKLRKNRPVLDPDLERLFFESKQYSGKK
tara:strand:+ start:33 stop:263 length:231 start_codon:yes stop_codon:yes gene_type:complete